MRSISKRVPALAVAALFLSACSGGGSTAAQPSFRVLGYYTGETASATALKAAAASLTDVSCDLYSIAADGTFGDTDEPDILSFDAENGIRTWACVSNYGDSGFDGTIAHSVIATYSSAAIAAMVGLAVSADFAGINLDFESIPAADRAAFSSFVSSLASALHAEDRALMLSVPAKEEEDAADSWSGAFDYAALGASADFLQLMTYDENGTWGDSGPVSGADWVVSCLSYADSEVSPAKLLGGIPAYGYDWDLDNSDNSAMRAWTEFPALIAVSGSVPSWDETAESPSLTYTDSNGDSHVLWYENAASIKAKVALCRSAGLGGISVWCLGDDDASFWTAVDSGL